MQSTFQYKRSLSHHFGQQSKVSKNPTTMNTKQYLFVAAVAFATFMATAEAQVSILDQGTYN